MDGKQKLILAAIDRMTVGKMMWSLAIGIVTFGCLYFALSYATESHGLSSSCGEESISFLESLYFSLVTITSLGYGDFSPLGFSRFLAVLEVVGGLMFIALLVSKASSERASNLTRLMYTADLQRTFREYSKEIGDRRTDLTKAIDNGDGHQVAYVIEGLKIHLISIHSHYGYHRIHGELTEDWSNKASARLANACYDVAADIKFKTFYPFISKLTKQRARKVIVKTDEIIKMVTETHGTESMQRLVEKSRINLVEFDARNAKNYAEKLQISDWLLKTVYDSFPEKPWPKHVQKVIAKKLGLSNHAVTKAIDELIVQDRIRF